MNARNRLLAMKQYASAEKPVSATPASVLKQKAASVARTVSAKANASALKLKPASVATNANAKANASVLRKCKW